MTKSYYTGVPVYLKENLVPRPAARQTQSAALPLLTVPRLTTDFARRSFSYAAPVTWNSLPANITLSDSEHGFKRQLKTFLFQQSAWLTLHQRLCSLGFYGALEICILLLLLL